MVKLIQTFIFGILFSTEIFAINNWSQNIEYLHPCPGSRLVSRRTTIIVRFRNDALLNNESNVQFSVIGRKSGKYIGRTVLSRDRRTFIFKPHSHFEPGDQISVTIRAQKVDVNFTFLFTVSPNYAKQQSLPLEYQPSFRVNASTPQNKTRQINGVSVPADFPNFVPSIITQPTDELLFVTTWNYLMLLQSDGTPLFYHKYSDRHVWDFTLQPSGVLSYMVGATAYTMDNHFEVTGEYSCGHGYYTDPHEFQLLPNKHALLIAWESQVIDMSQLIQDGKKDANVIGTHIQELDRDHYVVFEWRCWDHYSILDALHENLTAKTIHSVHMNAIDVDYDGHLLVSSRHLDEITKINRNTGEIIWRLGGRNNQFTFVNDPDGFTYQHDIRAVPRKPGHYTLMDNGNFHVPKYSRAVEYKLDTLKMTAEKVWEFRHTPDRYTHWMGNVQRLPDNNTIIGWSYNRLPKITEVTPEGTIVYEANYTTLETCYRVHRYHWTGRATRPHLLVESHPDKVSLIFNQFGDPGVQKYFIYADTTKNPQIRIDSTSNTFIYLTNLVDNKKYYFRVTSVNSSGAESNFSNQVQAYVHYVQPGENLILNGDFSQYLQYWILNRQNENMAQWDIEEPGQLHIEVLLKSNDPSDVQLLQQNVKLINDKTYQLEFDAYANETRVIEVKLYDEAAMSDYSKIGLILLTDDQKRYTFEFVMKDPTDYQSRLAFNFALSTGDVYIDNIILKDKSSTAVENKSEKEPGNSCLYLNYPNPFNASTTIRYFLPSQSRVELTFFDMLGRLIKSEKYDKQAKGEYQYIFDSQHLSSGVYFCKFEVQSFSSDDKYVDILKILCIK